jgi:large subunit ribosomal protein L9
MKVILLKDIKNIGKKSEVKDLNPGYVRNFLIPNKLVEIATPNALQKLAKEIAVMKASEADLIKHLEQLAGTLTNKKLIIEVKTDKKGSVFGSVTKDTILKGMREAKLITTERPEIKLENPLKTAGDYQIEISFKKGIKTSITVTVQPQQ